MNMNNTTELTVANTTIRQDAEGRYCLNDLHKAAGGKRAQHPNAYCRATATELLINLVDQANTYSVSPIDYSDTGPYQGTYCVTEILHDYAMWISARFHLEVINAHIQFIGSSFRKTPTSYAKAFRVAADRQDEFNAVNIKSASEYDYISDDAAEALDYRPWIADKHSTLAAVVQYLPGVDTDALVGDLKAFNYLPGVDTDALVGDLKAFNYLYENKHGYWVYSKYLNVLFGEKSDATTGVRVITVLAKGKAVLIQLYAEGRLTMLAE